MLLSSKRAKSVSKTFKYSVFGFIREYEEDQSKIVPITMKCICLDYYLLDEKFVEHGSKIEVDKSLNIIRMNQVFATNVAYGNVPITDYDESILEYQWTFKLLHFLPHLNLYIGIESSNKKRRADDFVSMYLDSIFRAAHFTQELVFLDEFGKDREPDAYEQLNNDIQEGDHIVMTLNTNDKTLKFKINETKIKGFIRNIELKNKEYHMAVAMKQTQCLQLIDFSIKQN